MYWTYRALTRSGQEVGTTLQGKRKAILESLTSQGLSLIEINPSYGHFLRQLSHQKKLSSLASAVFFEDFSNMLETGMSVPQIISIFKETNKNEALGVKLSHLYEQLRLGRSLTEAIVDLNIFPWIVNITLSAGEKTGRLNESFKTLGQYFRRSYLVKSKMKQLLIYPVLLFTLLLVVMFFISLHVIPQLKSLLPTEALHNSATQILLQLSFFLQNYSLFIFGFLLFGVVVIYVWAQKERLAFQEYLYQCPVIGNMFKESALALYLLNLSVLLKSKVALLEAINDLNAFNPSPVAKHFLKSREYMLGGSFFWQAIEQDPFFPRIIPSTIHRAEEMVKLDEYCLSLSEYFYKRTNTLADNLLHVLQPGLLAIGGLFLVLIAFAFLLPIYGSLTTIATGH